jgi:hypothetical protein
VRHIGVAVLVTQEGWQPATVARRAFAEGAVRQQTAEAREIASLLLQLWSRDDAAFASGARGTSAPEADKPQWPAGPV